MFSTSPPANLFAKEESKKSTHYTDLQAMLKDLHMILNENDYSQEFGIHLECAKDKYRFIMSQGDPDSWNQYDYPSTTTKALKNIIIDDDEIGNNKIGSNQDVGTYQSYEHLFEDLENIQESIYDMFPNDIFNVNEEDFPDEDSNKTTHQLNVVYTIRSNGGEPSIWITIERFRTYGLCKSKPYNQYSNLLYTFLSTLTESMALIPFAYVVSRLYFSSDDDIETQTL